MNHHLIPNWTESVAETYEFRTTVFTSRSGKEQRMAERLLPRRSVTFSTMLWDEGLRTFQAFLHARGASTVSIPDPARFAGMMAESASIGATHIVLQNTPEWLRAGSKLALSDLLQSEFRNAGSIVPDGDQVQVNLTAPLTKAWPMGTVVRPVIEGRLAKEVVLEFKTDSVATANTVLTILPPSQVPDLGDVVFETFDGRPVLITAPNWTELPSVTHSTPFEEVDYGRGVTRNYLPIEFYTRITQFNYLGRSREDIAELLTMFVDMRGRQGEFYCPSWISDMVAASGIAADSDELTVYGNIIATTYDDSTVNKAVAIRLNNGQWIFRKVISIVATSSSGAGSYSEDFSEDFDAEKTDSYSLITFDEVVDQDIYRRDIAMICWLNVCRFASDSLSIQWSTDDIGQAVLQIMTLEALPAE